eukprot:TRINITY_DN10728_c0_g1_i2.p1 TRINITY_DN10728_c0_g1~~TRINITY_DN10728_c0_g1_i2.p1  ORF type:complete len:189 (-),score=18.94 TRINITY_DN10728_c0_g1_i2:73-639(-)
MLKFQKPNAHPAQDLDLTHLGTLFVMDKSRSGKFYAEEIIDFCTLYLERHAKNKTNVDFLKEFQGYCTLQLWNFVSNHGQEAFVDWFCKLFSHNRIFFYKTRPKVVYLTQDSIKTLHEILNISKTYGLEFQSFFDLCQKVGQEMKLYKESKRIDDVVPLEVIKIFAADFITGFIKYMEELGFEPDMNV